MFPTLLAILISPRTWADPEYVRIKPGADLYSAREMATGERAGSWMPWNSWREHCRSTGARAERILDQDGVSALRIDVQNCGCGYFFRTFDEDFDRVFVKSDQVEPDDRDEDTAAGIVEPDCPDCHGRGGQMQDFAKIALAGMAKSDFIKQQQPEKTAAELEAYFSCYRTPFYGNYARLYRRLYAVVGKTAQVTYQPGGAVEAVRSPQALQDKLNKTSGVFWLQAKPSALACVSLRESKFDPGAKSEADKHGKFALGIGQQREVAVKEMNCVLNGCVLNKKNKSAKPWVRDVWDNIFRTARRTFTAAEYKELMTNAETGQPCRPTMEDQVRDAACPINSIATLAVAQLEGALAIRRTDGRHDEAAVEDYGGDQAFDLTVATAASNLAGRKHLTTAIGSTEDTSQWTRALNRAVGTKEARGNAEALINCLQSGNYNPPWTMKAGEKPRDCSRQREAAAE